MDLFGEISIPIYIIKMKGMLIDAVFNFFFFFTCPVSVASLDLNYFSRLVFAVIVVEVRADLHHM